MIRINEIMDKVAAYLPQADQDLITKAYVYSASAHAGQTRLSGEPYLSHPLEVANILADMRLDGASVASGLLHDTVEDTMATIEEIEEKFGDQVADIVDGVTKISLMTFGSKEAAQAENIRKMILAMAEDIRVILVKLADRLHNMRTMDFQKPLKRQLIAQETMDIYAPLANRLGLHRIKVELEDLSFKHLKPDLYNQILEGVELHQKARAEAYIEKVIVMIADLLEGNGIKGRVVGRKKHLWSIHNKMKAQGLTLDEVHDIVAFRVIVGSLKDCYAVLGLVHSLWKPVHGRFKDYISMPKANMYQSLHTTVIGPEGERIEIQIRTEEMNQLAEYGVAAHWAYKERGSGKMAAKDAERFTWLRQIMDWQREATDPKEFLQSLRYDLFQDEVYVFTPRGDVKELPEGATPVDFAYLIHTQVGSHCAGAKINGRLAPLSTALKNGDTVEIITDKSRSPSRDWLKFVKTAKARTRIRHWIKTEERAGAIALGRELLEKEGRKYGVNVQRVLKEDGFTPVLTEFNFPNVDELLCALGYSKLTPRRVLRTYMPKPEAGREELEKGQEKPETPKSKGSESIRIEGVDNVLVSFAGCCTPLPGEPIVGYISRGRGVIVHTHDCPSLANYEPERLLQVSWEGQEDKPYPAKIVILAKNAKGVLAKIAKTLSDDGVNIAEGSFSSSLDGRTENVFTVEVKDASHLYRAIDHLAHIEEVIEVRRLMEEDGTSQLRSAG